MTHTKKKIILAVSNDLISDNRVHKVAMSLVEQGNEVIVIGRKLPVSSELPQMSYKTKRFKLFFNKNMSFYAELNIRLFFYLLFSSADIYTANDLDTLLGVYCASKIRRKKLVYDSHEYFTEVPELANNLKAKKVWLAIESYIFPKLSHCMTVCDSISKIYQEKYNVPVKVVRNVPFFKTNNFDKAKVEGIENSKVILYQGAVNMGRGLELMLETMKFIDSAKLIIIGSGDTLTELQESVKTQNLEDKIIFLGRIHFSELPSYTQLATIGISLEENISLNYYYALPNKVFDYIQSSIPVLVSDLPEMRSIVETYSCGEIVLDRTPEKLAHQIIQMISNSQLLEKYSQNTILAAQELCWEKEKETLFSVYNF